MYRNNKASVMPLVALLLTTILGMGALVLDVSQAYTSQTKVKNALDLSALAGISQLTSQSNIPNVKSTALDFLNNNLINTITNFNSISLDNENLLIQVGVYDFINMTFTPNELAQNINAIMISYTYDSPSFLGNIFMGNRTRVSDGACAVKQVAGQMPPGGGFPVAIQSSVLAQARANANMVDLVQSGDSNSFFSAFMSNSASAGDIKNIIDYFQNEPTGIKPPSLTTGETFQINNGNLTSVYMSINSDYFIGMTFVSPIVSVNDGFSSMVTVQGFVGFTINNIYQNMNQYHIEGTIIPGYIDNTWSGLTISAGPGNISSQDQALLANSFGLTQ